jgi:NAD(P)-dependent dehydrogenase (short-subunit alcohol dehydrogenase family)
MPNNNVPFQGKTALITGASSGIGLATALAFSRQGAHVMMHYNRQAEGGEVLARVCQGGTGELLPGDLSSMGGVRAVVRPWADGRSIFLVNNAGVSREVDCNESTGQIGREARSATNASITSNLWIFVDGGVPCRPRML